MLSITTHRRTPHREVCPPPPTRGPWWRTAWHWLSIGWSPEPARVPSLMPVPGVAALDLIKQEFFDAVADIRGEAADALLDRIHAARSLRELWHLRVAVFRLVALERDQVSADARLAALNRHFPTRSPRSGFGPLAPRGDMWP